MKKIEKSEKNKGVMSLSRRHFVQTSAALVTVPFFARNAQANVDESLPIAKMDGNPATVV
ncbi:hypothetical protein HA378_33540, partial [Escherichia coli]|nr:hypothetical protein [Escherichia coli]